MRGVVVPLIEASEAGAGVAKEEVRALTDELDASGLAAVDGGRLWGLRGGRGGVGAPEVDFHGVIL